MERKNFYKKKILEHITDKKSKILVLGAGKLDVDIFKDLNFENVKFSNINAYEEREINQIQILHQINLDSNSYDYCVAHACIHHSSKPHNAILEMYRVSRKGTLIIEANDSFISRLACNLNLSEEYEKSAVLKNKNFGGVDNTDIPNYVYRWTEREVIKLMNSYKPEINHRIYFDYAHSIKFTESKIIKTFLKILFKLFKKQQNLFSIFIEKNIKNPNYRSFNI
tara:strand:+ start:24 stop:695 length:672 start_codon:yes stop_codon:yes gene_type:complete